MSRSASRRSHGVVAAVAALCTAMLAAHYLLVFLHVAPYNPVTSRMSGALDAYISPLFEQNWSLFAPEPLESDRGVLVRAQLKGHSSAEPTAWLDITSPELELVRGHLLPGRVARLSGSAFELYSSTEVELREAREQFESTHPSVRIAESRFRRASALLTTVASLAAAAEWGDQVAKVQVRLVEHEVLRFSQRTSTDLGKITHRDLPWWEPAGTSPAAVSAWRGAHG